MATPQFAQSTLIGAESANWTSLQFGPDGRLYASMVDGTIKVFTIEATSSGYEVTATETIDLIKQITNYNDDGAIASAADQGQRQVTGILVASATSTSTADSTSTTLEASTTSTLEAAAPASGSSQDTSDSAKPRWWCRGGGGNSLAASPMG